MMMRLSDRLNISEEQASEVTSMVFTFLKKIDEKENVSTLPTEMIFTQWNKYTHKPSWLREKLNEDMDFIAAICDFIETYKNHTRLIDIIKEYDLKVV